MSEVFRVILIIASIGTCIYISTKLKKSQVDAHDVIFWLLFAGILLILSLFPKIADKCAKIMGIYSPENFVFLFIIFTLFMKVFLMTIKISQMEHKIMDLVEELAVREKLRSECEKEEPEEICKEDLHDIQCKKKE